MNDMATTWWFSADRKWHKGQPPPGWWQSSDRRWHPPTDKPKAHESPTAVPAEPNSAYPTTTDEAPDAAPADTPPRLHVRGHALTRTTTGSPHLHAVELS